MITVALPVWNSKRIAWLVMESLCRQLKPQSEWELIVFEEIHSEGLGESWFMQYEGRLKDAGCVYNRVITSDTKYPLPQKWVKMAHEADENSRVFIMCAADNYYHQWMLQDAENAIKEADWCIQPKGYFYDFSRNEVFFYQYNGIVGLQMYAKTSMVMQFEKSDIDRGVDGWFSKQMMAVAHKEDRLLKCFMDGSEHYKHTLCTNGLNNISTGRIKLLEKYDHPFYQSDERLENIVPDDISKRLRYISESLKTNDDLGK